MKTLISILFSLLALACNSKKKTDSLWTYVPVPLDATEVKMGDIRVLKGPGVLLDENKLVWGASVVKGEKGMFHMFFSTWDSGPDSLKFGDSWVLNSTIGYAVSNYPDRDFQFKKIILKGRRFDGDTTAWDAQMVHNPHIKKFNNKYYLYYIGSYDPGKQAPGSPGESLNKRNRVQQSQTIGVVEFENFEDLLAGNFIRPDKPILAPRTRVKKDNIVNPSAEGTVALPDNIIVVNPSVVFRPADKKYLLYFKGNFYDPNWRGIHGVALSDSPTGPFKAKDEIIFDIRMPDGKIASAEDPYVWYYSIQDRFYAIVKDFSGIITGDEPGLAVLSSPDGFKWEPTENPFFMKKQVLLKNNSIIKVAHLERPQLLLEDGGNPSVLYAACSIESLSKLLDTGTYNVHIPLIIKPEE
ncbi:MAG: glycoside hydrolase family protein [Bacteroidales bacterium]|nr:glycoside hydrolase family protein [Bacteroidales bacterium]